MSTLYEQLSKDTIEALKGRDNVRLSVLRLLKAAIKNAAIAKQKGEDMLSNDEVLELVRYELKKRREAVRMYRQAAREDSAAAEEQEAAVLEGYLPPQRSSADLGSIVAGVIAQTPEPAKNQGRIIGAVMARVRGQADGAAVKRIVEEMIAQR